MSESATIERDPEQRLRAKKRRSKPSYRYDVAADVYRLIKADDAAAMLSMSRVEFDAGVRSGRLPQAIALTSHTKRWRVIDLQTFARGEMPPAPAKPLRERMPRCIPMRDGATHLYRHFDDQGRLLYIGISISTIARLAQHRGRSHWFWSIETIKVKAYATRASALKAERIAIQREKPLHNQVHARKA